MYYRHVCLAAALALALPLGCSESTDGLERIDGLPLGSTRASLDACSETVPDTRKIDGIPAYAQCAAIEAGAVYSNNGIDTSGTKVGSDWVRTQFSGGYQCTELAHRYLTFKWKVNWIPNGNAGEWCNTQPPSSSGVVQTTTPVHGDLIVFAPSSCGADGTYGHVAVVDVVDATKGKVTVVEQNMARRGSYNTTCGKCFLHVVANDGTNPGQTIGGTSPAAADAGGKPAAVADAGSGSSRPRPDAAVDSGARLPVQDDDDEVAAPAIEPGKKADAGTKKDAGARVDEDEEEPTDESDDGEEEDEDDVVSKGDPAAAEGCSAGSAAPGNGLMFAFLLTVALTWGRLHSSLARRVSPRVVRAVRRAPGLRVRVSARRERM